MNASRFATALLALALPLGLAACGSEEEPPPTSAASTPAGEASEPTEEPTEATTSVAPTTEAAAEPVIGDWCGGLESSVEAIQGLIPEEGEWVTGPAESTAPGAGDTFAERVTCFLRQGDPYEGLVLTVQESQYAEEAAAGDMIAALRDDPDPMAATEDVEFGDEAIYTTYDGQMAAPPFASFSVVVREGDRLARVSTRDYTAELPADEQARRDQVIKVVEFLQGL